MQMEGGKVVVDFPNYHQTSEIVGDKLVEVSVLCILGGLACFSAPGYGPRGRPLGSRLYEHFPRAGPWAECCVHIISSELYNNPAK